MSLPITIAIPHRLGKQEAKARLDAGFANLAAEMGGGRARLVRVRQSWDGDRLHFQAAALGQSVTGRVEVGESEVRVEIDLPAFLANFANAIRGRVQNAGRLLLEKK
jgi:hypothetical protein